MVQARFAGAVGKCFKRWDAKPIDTADVDDASWVASRSSLLQQGSDELRQIENPMQVKRKNPGPGIRWIFVIRSAPVRPGVVDKNMEFLFTVSL